jgi:hypothetical protein
MRRLIASVVIASVALAAALVAGCGAEKSASAPKSEATKKGYGADRKMAAKDGKEAAGGQAPGGDEVARQDADAKPRKVIYTGSVSLVVEDFDEAKVRLTAHVKEMGGEVDRFELHPQTRHGTWTVRIPAGRADDFYEEIVKLGELRDCKLDSQDVTDAYYDAKSVLENLEKEEVAAQKMFERVEKNPNASHADLHATRNELARIRGEIHVLKGRLKRWDKDVAFTTYTVTLYDRRGYVPPPSPEFSSTIGRTFWGSVEALKSFGKALVLIAVALAPWLPVIALVVAAVWLLIRWASRSRPAPPSLPDAREDRRPRRQRREEEPQPVFEVVEEKAAEPPAEQKPAEPRREGPEGD